MLCDSLRLARRCVNKFVSPQQKSAWDTRRDQAVDVQQFRCRVHWTENTSATQAETKWIHRLMDSGAASVETGGFAQFGPEQWDSEPKVHQRVPLQSRHLTWECEVCGSPSFGAVASIGSKQKGRTILSNKTRCGQTGPPSISNLQSQPPDPDLTRTPQKTTIDITSSALYI